MRRVLFFAKNLEINKLLYKWYAANKRELPWRYTKDPYKIWLSEIILQQTRVAQGLPFYLKFVEQYPTIADMASADEQEILSLWQGLGYYSRARNMHTTAQNITQNYFGHYPSNYLQIRALKGVGEYTAAAIASFAFDLPYPVIDGNVYRVIARLFALQQPINKPSGQLPIKTAVAAIFDHHHPALFNQAIMEFGALQCTPKKPLCMQCPLKNNCMALEQGLVDSLPKKEGKTKIQTITHSYFHLRYQNKTYIEKRTMGIWQNLYQFILTEQKLEARDAIIYLKNLLTNSIQLEIQNIYTTTHLLSHRKINAIFYTIVLKKSPIFSENNIFEIELESFGKKYPTSVLIQNFLNHCKTIEKQ